jgi:signal transduction histidine kinase
VLYIINRVEDVTEFVRLSRLQGEEMRANQELKLQTKEMETELFERLRELDKANQRLREVNSDLETFAGTVSHDLQAPLRQLRGFAQILLNEHAGELDVTGKEHLKTIIDSGAQMSTLIQDLLAYSRISRCEIPLEPVSLPDVVATVVQRISVGEEVRKLRIDIPPGLPQVVAHRTTLTQVILNLVWNAKKFVKPGQKAELVIAAKQTCDCVRICVRDQGIGIAPEHLERIFKPFERLNSMERYPGSGIGLAIVKRGAERMNGRVGVESRMGEGSSFWIELPALL